MNESHVRRRSDQSLSADILRAVDQKDFEQNNRWKFRAGKTKANFGIDAWIVEQIRFLRTNFSQYIVRPRLFLQRHGKMFFGQGLSDMPIYRSTSINTYRSANGVFQKNKHLSIAV